MRGIVWTSFLEPRKKDVADIFYKGVSKGEKGGERGDVRIRSRVRDEGGRNGR